MSNIQVASAVERLETLKLVFVAERGFSLTVLGKMVSGVKVITDEKRFARRFSLSGCRS